MDSPHGLVGPPITLVCSPVLLLGLSVELVGLLGPSVEPFGLVS